MGEVAAEKSDKGRANDPVAAARRRAMTLKLRQARQTLTTNSIDFAGQYASLARLFANSVVGATPVMALVATRPLARPAGDRRRSRKRPA